MADDPKSASTEPDKSASQRDYRLSLTLARRVVRRVIELERLLQKPAPASKPAEVAKSVPNPASFQCSVRMIRRVMRRVSEQEGKPPASEHAAADTL